MLSSQDGMNPALLLKLQKSPSLKFRDFKCFDQQTAEQ